MSARPHGSKVERISMRVRPEDNRLVREAAAIEGRSLSDFMVESARIRAHQLLADRTRFVLSDVDWDVFAAELDRPPRVVPAMAELLSGDYHTQTRKS